MATCNEDVLGNTGNRVARMLYATYRSVITAASITVLVEAWRQYAQDKKMCGNDVGCDFCGTAYNSRTMLAAFGPPSPCALCMGCCARHPAAQCVQHLRNSPPLCKLSELLCDKSARFHLFLEHLWSICRHYAIGHDLVRSVAHRVDCSPIWQSRFITRDRVTGRPLSNKLGSAKPKDTVCKIDHVWTHQPRPACLASQSWCSNVQRNPR